MLMDDYRCVSTGKLRRTERGSTVRVRSIQLSGAATSCTARRETQRPARGLRAESLYLPQQARQKGCQVLISRRRDVGHLPPWWLA